MHAIANNLIREKIVLLLLASTNFHAIPPAEYKSIFGRHLSQTTKLEKSTISKSTISKSTISKSTISKSTISKSTKTAPDSLDWREKGIVNPIKDQGSCGSSWHFQP